MSESQHFTPQGTGVGRSELSVQRKPEKPSDSYPLYAHRSGKWAKKIAGKTYYFGSWDAPELALKQYLDFVGDQGSGSPVEMLSLYDACNHFLDSKHRQVEGQELSQRSYLEYRSTCKALCEFFGGDFPTEKIRPLEFAEFKDHRSSTRNIVSLGNEIQRVRSLFKWLHQSRLIEEPEFGPDFKKAGRKAIKRHKRVTGGKDFEDADQIHRILFESGQPLKAMVMLGLSCGYGPTDIATLELSLWNQSVCDGFLEYPRRKTEAERLAWLWPETVDEVNKYLERRPEPLSGNENTLFIMHSGKSYDQSSNPISRSFTAARAAAGIKSGGFYGLRHTLQTQGSNARDQVALDYVFGHSDGSMAANYRSKISNKRVRLVGETVRDWFLSGRSDA